MKRFLVLFLFFLTATVHGAFAQSHPRYQPDGVPFTNEADTYPIITYKENFFNGHTYFAEGKKIKASEVKKILQISPEDAKEFSIANQKLATGATLRWGALALGAAANVYLLTTEISQSDLVPLLGMLTGAIVLDIVGIPMRREGKRRSSNALENYNYKVSRNLVYQPTWELKLSPLKTGIALNF
ncbi:hypothetical protein [Fontibacter flavus]|uniref:DUF4199 domain-containing protein n=1 Tax=Fontibacter flavus TaxID=654838 RepID=A0ABV6FR22_9BACT